MMTSDDLAGTTTLTTFQEIGRLTPDDAKVTVLSLLVVGKKQGADKGGAFLLRIAVRRTGSTVTQIGSTEKTSFQDAGETGWDAQVLFSGADVVVEAHGNNLVAETVDWTIDGMGKAAP